MKKDQKRSVLIVSNMYPSIQKKYSGIFVKNQFDRLKELFPEDQIDIFYMRRTFTSKLGSLLKYLTTFFKFTPYFFRRYDVIHLHYFFPLIILIWLYKFIHPGTKSIVTFHGSDINIQVNDRNKRFLSFLARKVDFTIPVGRFVSEQVKTKLGLEEGKVLSVGIDERVFYEETRKEILYDFIFVGSFFEVKGIDRLYKAIIELDKSVKYCIVGKGEPYEQMFAKLVEQGYSIDIKIDQSQEELRSLYNSSRFLVLPSRSEGFSTVTVEGMFCGIPAITSDIPQFKEQIKEGINGLFFDATKEEDLIRIMQRCHKMNQDEYDKLKLGATSSFKELSLTNICRELSMVYWG